MLRLLADENIPKVAITALRMRGHDVRSVGTDTPGARDIEVLSQALSEKRVLITFDKDFGELVFRAGKEASCGVVLFRIALRSPHSVAQAVVQALESRTDWVGHFSIVDDSRIRMTRLPEISSS